MRAIPNIFGWAVQKPTTHHRPVACLAASRSRLTLSQARIGRQDGLGIAHIVSVFVLARGVGRGGTSEDLLRLFPRGSDSHSDAVRFDTFLTSRSGEEGEEGNEATVVATREDRAAPSRRNAGETGYPGTRSLPGPPGVRRDRAAPKERED
ncbi:hypothetical protein THAOC_27451 [Thalassiosira oceanica]|uniref:Uncharacterized protein n=1 Tax=Thalassiosira oceanica TaxID=159749 RepID=K0S2R8_THAOC|nr:hypothetical protein THAOC_27451 [Thalassiosira oceanica]|eukprot:EJK53167.1 hypothetical protein THAOC_27451 [Thalassiosira oceanica]